MRYKLLLAFIIAGALWLPFFSQPSLAFQPSHLSLPVSPQPDKRQIQAYLEKYLRDYESIEFQIQSAPKEYRTLRIDTLQPPRMSGVFCYVPVLISQRAEENTRSMLTLKVKLLRKVLVALTGIKRGENFGGQNFGSGIKDVAVINGTPLTDTEKLKSCRAKQDIPAGTVITSAIIEPVPVIKRGQKIMAYSIRGNVEVSFEAEARQDGAEGEIIRIISEGNKLFRARVADSLSVIVGD